MILNSNDNINLCTVCMTIKYDKQVTSQIASRQMYGSVIGLNRFRFPQFLDYDHTRNRSKRTDCMAVTIIRDLLITESILPYGFM